ncbi:UPF0029-domain-containing protein [Mytilinidion resinicola]|uniref:UPF0029-domain-containing protein n=1 Tax=Mytilinidion resinicola TaxID=574789 RepID=A0A6A6Y0L5_9PEZI|nr:UPF0029-domain-containing protein [Mytilinidion resinicola]KAF2801554.1 UPF0029-domain-containing protein [Mytilinidion resinicola]
MTSTNPTLDDELTSINSIFNESTLTPISEDPLICTLTLPSLPSVSLRLEFPPSYPDAPPSILGTQTVGDDIPKGVGTHIVDIARATLAEIYTIGEPCIYDLLEELREALEKAQDDGRLGIHEHEHEHEIQEDLSSRRARDEAAVEGLGEAPPWTLAPPISEKKSVFLARVARVDSPAQAKLFLAHLLATDKKAAKATHNITAWRIRGSDNAHAGADITYQDCDDDGETAAGGRVLHLMQLMDVWDVMVVVTRWYGGVHLGPDRFRIINSAAREALVLGGFVKGEAEGKGRKKP